MFREHAKLFTKLQFITDLVFSAIAFPLAYLTRTYLGKLPWDFRGLLNPELHSFTYYLPYVGLAVCWWVVSAFSLGLYRITIRRSDLEKMKVVLETSILLGLCLGFLSFALKLDLSRPLIAFFAAYQALLLLSARLVVMLRSRLAHTGAARRHILIVGNSEKAREMGELISRYRDWGLRILGYVTVNGKGEAQRSDQVLGTIDDLSEIVQNHVVDEIIFVGQGREDLGCFDDVLSICKEQGIKTRVAVDIFPAKVSQVSMDFLENVPILTFGTTPDHALSLFIKRAMDVILSAAILVLSLPLMIVVGLMVKLTSKGPIIYRQVRCGLYGRKFVLHKYRSMREGAEDVLWEIKHLNEMDGPVFKMRDDPRVTPLGRFLRKRLHR